jgi:hypothetical protein
MPARHMHVQVPGFVRRSVGGCQWAKSRAGARVDTRPTVRASVVDSKRVAALQLLSVYVCVRADGSVRWRRARAYMCACGAPHTHTLSGRSLHHLMRVVRDAGVRRGVRARALAGQVFKVLSAATALPASTRLAALHCAFRVRRRVQCVFWRCRRASHAPPRAVANGRPVLACTV